jgi:hypothetical protein
LVPMKPAPPVIRIEAINQDGGIGEETWRA